jgi:DNA-binding GntR family transcriptional regulator
MTPTQASSVYDRIQQDILTGRLKPGERLRLRDLIDAYDTGNSPLREALNRLSSNGLVVREENRGFSVPYTSLGELEELIRTRCWLEEIALRESIANGDAEWEERLVLAFHWLKQAYEKRKGDGNGVHDECSKYHKGFHRTMLSACNSEILLEFCDQLQARTYRYRNLAEVVEHRDRHELEEHSQLHDAVLARDTEKALEKLHQHYKVTLEILSESGRFE